MTISIKVLNDQIKYVSRTNTLLDMLLRFEKVLDDVNLYAFRNWIHGEIVEGPELQRHYITVKLMYPYKEMPDPAGAERLLKIDCLVKFEKDILETPMPAEKFTDAIVANDYQDGSEPRKYEIKREEVWCVTIKMPRRYVDEFESVDGKIDADESAESVDVKSAQTTGAPSGGAPLGGGIPPLAPPGGAPEAPFGITGL